MRTLHIVGKDFELRLGIDTRAVGQQEVAIRLRRVGQLRPLPHDDAAVENRPRTAANDAFVLLPAVAVRLGVINRSMRIGQLVAIDHRQATELALTALGGLHDIDVVARQTGAKADVDAVITATVCDRHSGVTDMKTGVAFALHTHVIDVRIVGEHELPHRIGQIGFRREGYVILDHRGAAAGRRDNEAARITRHLFLRSDKQQMHRPVCDRTARQHDQGTVVDESRIHRGKRVLLIGGNARKLGLDQRRLGRQRRRQRGDDHRAVLRRRQLRRVNAIDEHQTQRCIGKHEGRDIRSRQCRRAAHRLVRQMGERREIGKAPVFIARGRYRQRADALNRTRAHTPERIALLDEAASRQEIGQKLLVCHRHHAAAPTPFSAPGFVLSQSYPRDSSSSASAFGPVLIMRPASVTCT